MSQQTSMTTDLHHRVPRESSCAPGPTTNHSNNHAFVFFSLSPSYTVSIASIEMQSGADRRQGAELSAEQRAAIVHALKNKLSTQAELSRKFGCHRNTIANTYKRWQERNDTESRPRTGRPSCQGKALETQDHKRPSKLRVKAPVKSKSSGT